MPSHAEAIAHARRVDPSQTTQLRREYEAEATRRFKAVGKDIVTSVYNNDCFGLKRKPGETFVIRTGAALPKGAFAFGDDAAKVANFMRWLENSIEEQILELRREANMIPKTHWQGKLVSKSWKKGAVRAKSAVMATKGLPVLKDAINAAMDRVLNSPFHQKRLMLLYGRNFSALKGITQVMSNQISAILTDGMAQGWGPYTMARQLRDRVDKIGITRAKMLARTEIIRANSEATLSTFEEFGVQGVSVLAEWITAGFGVCPKCMAMQQRTREKPLTIAEARNLIPLHPNCRCSWVPVVDKGQAKGKAPAPGQPVPSLTPEQAFKQSIAHQIKTTRAKGIDKVSEVDFRKLGETVRKEIERRLRPLEKELKKRIEKAKTLKKKLDDEYVKLSIEQSKVLKRLRELDADDPRGEALLRRYHEIRARLTVLDKETKAVNKLARRGNVAVSDLQAEVRLEVLKDIRKFGNPKGYNLRGSKPLQKAFNDATEFYPTDWLNLHLGDVFYRGGAWKLRSIPKQFVSKWDINLSTASRASYNRYQSLMKLGGRGPKQKLQDAVHEMGHLMQDAFMRRGERLISKIEKEFLLRRTKGERLQWLGRGYDRTEKSRFDRFGKPYCGKAYGDDFTEILTMGAEALFTPSAGNAGVFMYKGAMDYEYMDLILGMLAGL